jgi:hypothetical protein
MRANGGGQVRLKTAASAWGPLYLRGVAARKIVESTFLLRVPLLSFADEAVQLLDRIDVVSGPCPNAVTPPLGSAEPEKARDSVAPGHYNHNRAVEQWGREQSEMERQQTPCRPYENRLNDFIAVLPRPSTRI